MFTFVAQFGRHDAHEGVRQRCAGAPVEEIALDRACRPSRDRDIAAIVERLLQRLANLRVGGQRGNPALEILSLAARDATSISSAVRMPQLLDLQMLLLLGRHALVS